MIAGLGRSRSFTRETPKSAAPIWSRMSWPKRALSKLNNAFVFSPFLIPERGIECSLEELRERIQDYYESHILDGGESLFESEMITENGPDPDFIRHARRVLAERRSLRWRLLLFAAAIAGFLIYIGILFFKRLDNILHRPDVTEGLITGFTFGFVVVAFGAIVALCIGKAFSGFDKEVGGYASLLEYHEQLKASLRNREPPDQEDDQIQ